MTACMESELQGWFENTDPHLIIQELDALYAKHARTEWYEVTHALWNCKMKEGSPVSEHVIKIMGFGQRLTQLGFPIPESLGTDIVLMSLPPSFKGFVQNYRMNGMDNSVNEPLAMLKNAETTMQADPNYMLAVNKTTSFKKKGKSKGKGAGKPGAKTKKPSGTGPNKDTECFYCKVKGH